MRTFTGVLLAGVTLFLAVAWVGASEKSLVIPLQLRNGLMASVSFDLNFDTSAITKTTEEDASVFSNSVYRIELRESSSEHRSVLRARIARLDGQMFDLVGFALRVKVPAEDIKGLWFPSEGSTSKDLMASDASKPVSGMADANEGIPYIAGVSVDSQNIAAIGLGRQDLAVDIGGEPREDGNYELRLYARTRRKAQVFDEVFYISNDRSLTWSDAAADYADWADGVNGYRPMPISDRAYEPGYDVWYFAGDRVDGDMYLKTAKLASELKLGSFLADSGWDAPAGDYVQWLSGHTGDYDPPRDKFRNLQETFNQIRSEYKLAVQLWLQPFAVGRESRRYRQTKDLHIHVPRNTDGIFGWPGFADPQMILATPDNTLENVNLCPRLAATQEYLGKLFEEVARNYKPDGYWLDFIDGMPSYCMAQHEHDNETFGEGLKLSLHAIRSAIQANTPNAVIQFRANYANLNTKEFSNVWQPEDSPGDFDRMRLKALRLRPFSRGVVFASDQLYWPNDVDDATVARFAMTSVMVGVPSFGPDLISMRPSACEILKTWVLFYRYFQSDLTQGRFIPFGRLPVPNHKIESESRTFVYLRNLDFKLIDAESPNIHLLNATDSDRIAGRLRVPDNTREYWLFVTDRFLNTRPGLMKMIPTDDGMLDLDIVVEQGAAAILIPGAERR
jgi:hypothetical protein